MVPDREKENQVVPLTLEGEMVDGSRGRPDLDQLEKDPGLGRNDRSERKGRNVRAGLKAVAGKDLPPTDRPRDPRANQMIGLPLNSKLG